MRTGGRTVHTFDTEEDDVELLVSSNSRARALITVRGPHFANWVSLVHAVSLYSLSNSARNQTS
jgi:hypothetical protein